MPQEILAVAIWEPLRGKESASLATIRELFSILSSKDYSRDQLFRSGSQYVLLRYWKSEETRRAAQEDPEIQRCWAKLGNEIEILRVYETLDEVHP